MDNSEYFKKRINDATELANIPYYPNSISPSILNQPCRRKILLSHIWAAPHNFKYNPDTLRRFQLGNKIEEYIIEIIKLAGFKIKHLENDQQIGYYKCNNHIHGKIDGIVEIANEEHILEIKSVNEKDFKDLAKNKLKNTIDKYYIQMQLYMHYLKIHSAFLIAYNKNNSELYIENIQYDRNSKKKTIRYSYFLRNKITTNTFEKFKKISSEPKWACKGFGGCPFAQICFSGAPMVKSCRNCIHAIKSMDKKTPGQWYCQAKECPLDIEDQKTLAIRCKRYKVIEF